MHTDSTHVHVHHHDATANASDGEDSLLALAGQLVAITAGGLAAGYLVGDYVALDADRRDTATSSMTYDGTTVYFRDNDDGRGDNWR